MWGGKTTRNRPCFVGDRAFPSFPEDDFLVVLGVNGRHYRFSKAWHARELPSLRDDTSTWLDFDVIHPLSEEYGAARRDEKQRVIRDLVASRDLPTASAIFLDSIDALTVDLSVVAGDRVVDVVCWSVDSRVDEVHIVDDRVVVCDATMVTALLRRPFDDDGAHLHVGAQLDADLRTGEVAISFDVRACDAEGDDLPGAAPETVAAVLARAFASGLADNGKAAARSPASVADLPPWDMPAHFVL